MFSVFLETFPLLPLFRLADLLFFSASWFLAWGSFATIALRAATHEFRRVTVIE